MSRDGDDDPVDRRIVEQVVGDDLGVHPRAVALAAAAARTAGTRPGVECEPCQSSSDAVAVVGVHGVEDALALGPRAGRCSRTPARWRGSCTAELPSAPMTEITSEMFATSPLQPLLRRAHRVLGLDPVGDVAGVRDDAAARPGRRCGRSRPSRSSATRRRRGGAGTGSSPTSPGRRAAARTAPRPPDGPRRRAPKSTESVGDASGVHAEEPPRARAAVA